MKYNKTQVETFTLIHVLKNTSTNCLILSFPTQIMLDAQNPCFNTVLPCFLCGNISKLTFDISTGFLVKF